MLMVRMGAVDESGAGLPALAGLSPERFRPHATLLAGHTSMAC